MRFTRSILLTGLSLAAACQGGPPQGHDGTSGAEASDTGTAGTQANDTGTAGTEASDTGTAGTEESDTGDETGGSDDALECVTLLESPWWMEQYSSYVTPDGRVLIAGELLDPQSNEGHAWVWAFDVDGTMLWSRDFGPGYAYAIHPRGEGFAFFYYYSALPQRRDFVSLDADGNVDETVVLGEVGVGPGYADWIETASGGVLLGGSAPGGVLPGDSEQSDFWLGRLDGNGTIETLVQEDYAGLPDRVVGLARYGDVIGVLVDVGVYVFWVGNPVDPIIGSTLLVEYDEQGVELRRTLLAMPGETIPDSITWNGKTLDVDADGTWIVGGDTWDALPLGEPAGEPYGWATAVRDGEILWTYESSLGFLYTSHLQTATVTDDILLAGYISDRDLGERTWALRLDSGTGEVLTELVGPALPSHHHGSQYTGSGVTLDERVWLVGMTDDYEVSQEQWLCTFAN
jgi:hypothetical protein